MLIFGPENARPFTPTYALRYGLTDEIEVGVQAGFDLVRGQATFQLLESRLLDLAVGTDLGVMALPRSDAHRVFGAPILAGLRPLPWLSIVGHAGPASLPTTWAFQAGGGLDVTALPAMSLRPHASFLFGIVDGQVIFDRPHVVFDLDFAFGGRR